MTTWLELADPIRGCTACGLAATRKHAVAGAGPALSGPAALPAVLQAFAVAWQQLTPQLLLRERIIVGHPELMGRAVLVQLIGDFAATAGVVLTALGRRLGLWDALAAGPAPAEVVAERAGAALPS